jgi:ABC-2 type transport system permease protein
MDGEIWDGRFDFTLLKPVHTQVLVSVRSWRPWACVDLGLSLVVLSIALVQLGAQLSLPNLAAFLVALTISVTIVYSISLLLTSGVFWYQGVPMIWIFDSLIQMGRYPVGIYPGWLKLVLTWIVPIGFITSVPAQTLTGQVSPVVLLGGGTLAAGLLVVASIFFRASLQRYSSASS